MKSKHKGKVPAVTTVLEPRHRPKIWSAERGIEETVNKRAFVYLSWHTSYVLRTLDRFILPQKIYLPILKRVPQSLRTLHRVIRRVGKHLPTIHGWSPSSIFSEFTSRQVLVLSTVNRAVRSQTSLPNGFVPRGIGAELIHGVAHPAGS
ncbi:hypothetical protein NPIL_141711 [Nephila pilipes]|uniref:Uncharacterized protein n=1 Tax=Nephila pilipes TaxID=299642 RepID=A0A8X6JX31_NEPPI|nr:hypothetical protein NPIL_141711 [Nephila pilipes]